MRRILRFPILLLLATPMLASAAPPAPVDLIIGSVQKDASAVPARAFSGSAVDGAFNKGALSASRIRVQVNGGQQLIAARQRETRGARGDVTWTGEFEGSPGSLLNITFHRGQVYGFMHHGADIWEIESRGASGVQLFKVDESRLPQEGPPRARPAGDTLGTTATGGVTALATAAEPIVQDMMVVYTQQAATAALNAGTNIETRIINAVAAANSAYANSGVNIQMNIVHMAQVAYTETGDMGVSLSRVQSTSDGYMDGVHALRDQYGADLVALVTNESNYCGIAYVNASASSAFSVTWWNCFSNQTFAHEVGHNQGNSHDRANGGGGAYAYSYGYRTCDYPALANGQSFRTVMAYSCSTSVPRVNYFSNPNLLYNGAAQMGISYELDAANSADNVRSMNNTAAAKAAFRATTGPLPAAPTSLAGTAVSSSQINLTWVDNASDETGYSLERASGGGSYSVVATLAANATSYSNTGLVANTAYSYRVRAYSSTGFSASYSNTVTVSTQQMPPPAAPTSLGGTAVSSTQINLTWVDNASDEGNYVVERATGAGSFATVATLAANVTSYSSTGLVASTSYSYRVKASNSGGSSAYSNTATLSTQAPPPPPPAPGSPTVTLASRTATIRWTDVAGETSYQLVREVLNTKNNTWSGTTTTLAANTTSRSESLSKGKTYRYKIRAVNAAGSSSYALVSCSSIAGCTNTAAFLVL